MEKRRVSILQTALLFPFQTRKYQVASLRRQKLIVSWAPK